MHIHFCGYLYTDGTENAKLLTRLLDFIKDYSWFSQCSFLVCFTGCARLFVVTRDFGLGGRRS